MIFTQEQIEDLLDNVLYAKHKVWRGNKIMLCCPIHHETHESCGINIDYCPENSIEHYTVFNCFSCHASGNISWLLFKSLPDSFKSIKEAYEFLSARYGITINSHIEMRGLKLNRIGDTILTKKKEVFPLSDIAPYKSGKETYEYFFDRGFTKETVKSFMIGRDLINQTVTVPIFYEDKKLAGVIGRYIDPNRPKNDRFKVYNFKKGGILFPLDHYIPNKDNEIILVEGLFDAVYMHQLGYTNTLSTLTNDITREQARQLRQKSDKFILMTDNDERGIEGAEKIKKVLKGCTFKTVMFPENKKDPCDCTPGEIIEMLNNLKGVLKAPLRRI